MKWKHTLTIAASLLVVGSLVYAFNPMSTVGVQFSTATDAGQCPPGSHHANCMDNHGEVPTWHYQDGGTASMVGGGGGTTITSGQVAYATGTNTLGGSTGMTYASSALTMGVSTAQGVVQGAGGTGGSLFLQDS